MTPAARRRWVAGLPAVAAVVAGGAVVAYLYLGSAAGRSGWYAAAAADADEAGDDRTAAVCYNRLLQDHPGDVDAKFHLATSLDAIGQADAARSLYLQLAPAAGPGYAPAHLRLAKRDLAGDRPSPAALDDAQRHLAPVLQRGPGDAEANYWLAVLCAERGRWELVATPAAQVGPLRDVLAQRLARVAQAQGNADQATLWAHDGGR